VNDIRFLSDDSVRRLYDNIRCQVVQDFQSGSAIAWVKQQDNKPAGFTRKWIGDAVAATGQCYLPER
jgi:hypothetical protein